MTFQGAGSSQGMAAAPGITFPCESCGQLLTPGELVCRRCGAFVYRARLEQLAAEAVRLEQQNPAAAAALWQQCLQLLPPDSQQFAAIYHRIGALAAGLGHAPAAAYPPGHGAGHHATSGGPYALGYGRQPAADDPLGRAVMKTAVSMLISAAVYTFAFGSFAAAIGFVVLILIHELGHVVANNYYGIKSGPPIFIPFVGAVINLRQMPKDAKEEAVIGIAGPIAGTAGALLCYMLASTLHAPETVLKFFEFMAKIGFFLNLFNLVPVPPMDGGRVAAAVSPWLWIPGLLALAGFGVWDMMHGHTPVLILLMVLMALPRLRSTLRRRGRDTPYYHIGWKATWTIGSVYVSLGVFLTVMFLKSGGLHSLGW